VEVVVIVTGVMLRYDLQNDVANELRVGWLRMERTVLPMHGFDTTLDLSSNAGDAIVVVTTDRSSANLWIVIYMSNK